MKIIEINKLYHPWVGGVETHVKDIAEGISDTFKVNVICCNSKNETCVEHINNVLVTKYKSFGRFFSLPISFAFLKGFANHPGNILHFHLPNPLAVISYILNPPKGKIVVTWHSDIIKQKFILFFYRPFLNHFLKKATRIIVTSPNMAKNSPFLKDHLEKVSIIPLGIPDTHLNNLPSIDAPQPFALFVGRLIYYKGVIELIEAMRVCEANVIIIGEGPLEPIIRKRAEDLIASGRLKLLPFQKREVLTSYFKSCEFFILPSTHPSEAFGIVQLEAMIHKKAVISTNLPTGVPYVNKHNYSGLIVSPGNINELAEAIQKLWTNQKLRNSFGENAYDRCKKEFTRDQMIKKTKMTFNNILNGTI
ncbi:MAG: glycosyltransferase [Candidatus Marinamargulisbacteria bacterium]